MSETTKTKTREEWTVEVRNSREKAEVSLNKAALEMIAEYYGDIGAFIEDHLLSECYSLEGAEAIRKHHKNWKIKRKGL